MFHNTRQVVEEIEFKKKQEKEKLRIESEQRVRENEKIEIAKELIKNGADNILISNSTKLSIDKIDVLRSEMKGL